MNKLLIVVFPLILSISDKKQVMETSRYIEFLHSGIEDKHIRPVIISTTKIDMPLTADELKHLKYLLKKPVVTKKEREDYLSSMYKLMKTDEKTYLTILNFIRGNNELFTNKLNKNNGEFENYTIITEGKRYSIFYKFKYKFFNELEKYLKVKNCDKKVINAINEL